MYHQARDTPPRQFADLWVLQRDRDARDRGLPVMDLFEDGDRLTLTTLLGVIRMSRSEDAGWWADYLRQVADVLVAAERGLDQ